MKIIAISDTHGSHRQLKVPNGDVLIHAGDVLANNYPNEIIDFNNWLSTLPHKHKIVIAGNHDEFMYNTGVKTIRNTYLTNCIYLENSSCIIDGIKFYGSPITPTFMDWFFMAERGKEIQNKYWSNIDRDTDVLVTHGPPMGIMDKVITHVEKTVGCADLLWTVKQLKPKVHIFGHIHAGHGIIKQDNIIFANASVMNEEYEIEYMPLEINI